MIALVQRVTSASVRVAGDTVAVIEAGVLALIGIRPQDDEQTAGRLLERVVTYRIFADAAGRMNLSLADVAGGLLLVPQFTLAADTRQGTRPGFSSAAPPQRAAALFDHLVNGARQRVNHVQSGVFGAHMQVSSINDGPATFWLES